MADNRFLVAAPASGHGKTTVALALMAALRRRGLKVAPFKVGPDFIDPGHHGRVCGRPSRNLDGWMCGRRFVGETFARGCAGADVAVVEGVMGLFDGAGGDTDEGSSAEIARWLDIPVILVVDAARQARSAAALVKGFVEFDPRLTFAGVIFNRVGSPRHEELLRQAVASTSGLPPVLGCLPREEDLAIPERHLGLVTDQDRPLDEAFQNRLAEWIEEGVDLEALTDGSPHPQPLSLKEKVAKGQVHPLSPGERVAEGRVRGKTRIGVARDEAFCFYYPENLELLERAGAELAFFSPLRDASLPEGVRGLYLGGGYPELYAERLSANRPLVAKIRQEAEGGLPVYAECGGFMFLCRAIDGRPLVGLYPWEGRMLPKRKALGYRETVFTADTPLGPAGMVARGHEFHYSEMEIPDSALSCYRLSRRGGADLGTGGYRIANALGSYVHLHFGSNPRLAENFVAFCKSVTRSREEREGIQDRKT